MPFDVFYTCQTQAMLQSSSVAFFLHKKKNQPRKVSSPNNTKEPSPSISVSVVTAKSTVASIPATRTVPLAPTRLAAYGSLRYLKWMSGYVPAELPIKLARKNNKQKNTLQVFLPVRCFLMLNYPRQLTRPTR